MARPKPRRPRPGRGLPPEKKLSPEELAEDERLREQLRFNCDRLDAILAAKWDAMQERQGLEAEQVTATEDPWF